MNPTTRSAAAARREGRAAASRVPAPTAVTPLSRRRREIPPVAIGFSLSMRRLACGAHRRATLFAVLAASHVPAALYGSARTGETCVCLFLRQSRSILLHSIESPPRKQICKTAQYLGLVPPCINWRMSGAAYRPDIVIPAKAGVQGLPPGSNRGQLLSRPA